MALISAFQQGFVPGLIYLLSLMLAMCVAVSFHEYAHAVVANKLHLCGMAVKPTAGFTHFRR